MPLFYDITQVMELKYTDKQRIRSETAAMLESGTPIINEAAALAITDHCAVEIYVEDERVQAVAKEVAEYIMWCGFKPVTDKDKTKLTFIHPRRFETWKSKHTPQKQNLWQRLRGMLRGTSDSEC